MPKVQPALRDMLNHPLFLPTAIFIFIAAVNVFLQPSFFKFRVIKSNLWTFTPLMLVSAGQAIIILCGELDLSVGTGISLVNCIIANIMTDTPTYIILAILLGFAAALGMGTVNGLLVGYLKLPSLITTFATSAVWFGFALFLRPQPGGYVPYFISRFYKYAFGFITVSVIIVVLALIWWSLLRHRKIGRYIYAVGSDAKAAFDSGIDTARVKTQAFIIGWVFVFLASFSLTVQMSSGDAYMGNPFALNSIAAVVVGGVSLAGGRGSVLGAIFGALTLSLVLNIIYFANISSVYQEFVKGAIIMFALAMTIFYKAKKL